MCVGAYAAINSPLGSRHFQVHPKESTESLLLLHLLCYRWDKGESHTSLLEDPEESKGKVISI